MFVAYLHGNRPNQSVEILHKLCWESISSVGRVELASVAQVLRHGFGLDSVGEMGEISALGESDSEIVTYEDFKEEPGIF